MKNNQPLVSVIIPTYQSAETLEACLRSVKEQTYPNVETIVVDNFSNDGTDKIAAKMATLIQAGPERSAQVNIGASHAHGEYLYRIDGDMIIERTVIQACVEKIQNEHFDAIAVPNRSTGDGFWQQVRKLERDTYLDDPLIVAARFWKKSAFESIGGMDESLNACEDYDLHNRLINAGYKIGRIIPTEYHLGEARNLWHSARKSFYYGPSRMRYIIKHPKRGMRQMNPFRSSYIRHWKALIAKPALLLGLIILKMVEYIFAGFGILASGLGLINDQGQFSPHALAALLLVIVSLLSLFNTLPDSGFDLSRLGLWSIFTVGLILWRVVGERRAQFRKTPASACLLEVSLAYSPLLLLAISRPVSMDIHIFMDWQILTALMLSMSFGWLIYLANLKLPEVINKKAEMPLVRNILLGTLLVVVTVFVLIFSLTSLKLLNTFSLSPYDIAIIDQALWTGWQNRLSGSLSNLMFSTINSRSIFAYDPSPILLLILPVYGIGWGGPELLIFLQSLALGLGAIALYKIGCRKINRFPALLITLAYLLSFLTIRLAVGRFYPLTLCIPLLLFAYEAFHRQRWAIYYLLLIFALACGVEAALIILTMGLYFLLKGKSRDHSIMTTVLGITWLTFILFAFVPFFGGSPAEAIGWTPPPSGTIGSTWVLSRILRPESIGYLWRIFASTGIIPLLQPHFLIPVLPRILLNLITENPAGTSLSGKFEITLLPFLFLAIIGGIQWLNQKSEENQWPSLGFPATLVTLSATLLTTILFLPNILSPLFQEIPTQQARVVQTGHQIISQIDPQASVATQSPFATHLAQRKKLTILPQAQDPNFILFDLYHPNREPSPTTYHETLFRAFNNPSYGLRTSDYGYLLFERGLDPSTKKNAFLSETVPDIQFHHFIELDETIAYLGFDLEETEVTSGSAIYITHYWQCIKPTAKPYLQFTAHPGGHHFEAIAFGLLPPNTWGPGDIVSHKQVISLPPLPEGDDYEIAIGLWYDEGEPQLLSPDQLLNNDVIRIAKISVSADTYTILPWTSSNTPID